MEQTLQSFEKAWQHFETSFKGKLRSKSKEQKITLSLANLTLKEVSSDWFSGYGTEGKWLRDYKSECPEKAEAVTKYLKYELKLGAETVQPQEAHGNKGDNGNQGGREESSSKKYVLPAVGAVAGGAIASALGAPYIVLLAAMAAPAVLLYQGRKGIVKSSSDKKPQATVSIDNFVGQLQMHRKKITGIIRGDHG